MYCTYTALINQNAYYYFNLYIISTSSTNNINSKEEPEKP